MEHRAIYQRAVERFGGIEAIKPLIPYSTKQVKEALTNGDEYLNTLPIERWDMASGFICKNADCIPVWSMPIWRLYRINGINAVSNTQGVCLLKEAARMLAEMED